MSIFDRIRRSPAQPQRPAVRAMPRNVMVMVDADGVKTITLTDGLDAWRGLNAGLERKYREFPANETGYAGIYYSVVWANRAINLRAQKVAAILSEGQVVDKRSGREIQDHPLQAAIDQTYMKYEQPLFELWEIYKSVTGETYIELVNALLFDTLNIPYCFRVLNSLAVEPIIERGEVVGYHFQDDSTNTTFKPDELATDRYFNLFSEHRGRSLLASVVNAGNVDTGLQVANVRFIKNRTFPTMIFMTKDILISDTDMERIRAAIKESEGPDNAGRGMILPAPLTMETLTPPTFEDQEYLTESQKRRMATAVGIPVGLIDHTDNNFQLSPEQNKNLHENTLFPAAAKIERIVNLKLLPFVDKTGTAEYRVPFDEIRAQFDDPAQRTQDVNAQYHAGILTFNQAQELQHRPTVPGGDFYLVPSGFTAVQKSELGSVSESLTPPAPSISIAPPQRPALPAPTLRSAGMIEGKATPRHTDALAELAAWDKLVANKGARKGVDFECYQIEPSLAELVKGQLELAELNGSPVANAIFKHARERLEGKAIQATRLEFELEFERLLGAGLRKDIERREFTTRLKSLLRRWSPDAYRDGLRDGGVQIEADEPLDEDDQQQLDLILAAQETFVRPFVDTVYGDGLTEKQTALKPAQWYSRSIQPQYDAGLLSADANSMVEFVGSVKEDSCQTCLALKGQIHRRKQFAKYDFLPPHGKGIICSPGGLCVDKLVRTNDKARGSLAGVPRCTTCG